VSPTGSPTSTSATPSGSTEVCPRGFEERDEYEEIWVTEDEILPGDVILQ
jgi:hypothetical protein